MILKNLERPLRSTHSIALLTYIYSPNHATLNEDRPTLLACRPSSGTVVSGSIRWAWIFTGVLRSRRVKHSSDSRVEQGFSDFQRCSAL